VPQQPSRYTAHRSTALRGAATTGAGATEAIVNGELFARPDFLETVEEDFSAHFAHRQIRIAAMIDELGATSTHGPIEHRAAIQLHRVNASLYPRQEHPHGATHGFPLADPFAGVLNDPLAGRDRFLCEHTKPFDVRPADVKLETGELRIQMRNMILRGHINESEQARGCHSAIDNPIPDSR